MAVESPSYLHANRDAALASVKPLIHEIHTEEPSADDGVEMRSGTTRNPVAKHQPGYAGHMEAHEGAASGRLAQAHHPAGDGPAEYVPSDEAEKLIDKHLSRWATLLERLK